MFDYAFKRNYEDSAEWDYKVSYSDTLLSPIIEVEYYLSDFFTLSGEQSPEHRESSSGTIIYSKSGASDVSGEYSNAQINTKTAVLIRWYF
ncbi:MAG: hypothetical protein HOC09_08415 [Deltaproteobacteria bacterium]|jgi:hypothetical protein|nr:hypothetical protein [Deltaproteobacteria bacterium]